MSNQLSPKAGPTPQTELHVPGAPDILPPLPPSTSGLPYVAGYEILRELGRGGTGVVYLARQQGLKRLVALKMILAGTHASMEALARLRTEAEAIARLQHSHIVQVFQVGEQDGLAFFAMEFVEGGSLDMRLAGIPQPPQEAARLVQV